MARPKVVFVFGTNNQQIQLAQSVANVLHGKQITHNTQYFAPMCIIIKVIPRQSNSACYALLQAGITLPAPIAVMGKKRGQLQYVFGG